MRAVKMVTDIVDLDRNVSDRWYVTNGATSVGPISLDLITRGLEAGKVPLESFVRNETWKVWRPIVELVEGGVGDRAPVVDELTDDGAARRSFPPPANSQEEMQSSLRGDDMSPDEAIAGATDPKEAMLLLMAAVVREIGAHAALVHEAKDGGAVVVCAHGGDLFEGLGGRVTMSDPAVVAAFGGQIVIAEPVAGPAGAVIRRRLGRGQPAPLLGAAMFPIRPRGKLYGTLEIGRRNPFLPRELARIEVLIDALVARLGETDGADQK
jgi:hypothetical protein